MSQTTDSGRFLAHEIETGLLSLELRLQKLRDATSAPGEVDPCLREVAALRRLARDYLLWTSTRVDSGSFPIAAVLEALGERFAPIAAGRGVDLDIEDGGEQMPSVRGDPRATERILSNLVANAIDFSPEASAVSLRVHRRGERVEVEVGDRGIGIAPEEQERVFEPFVRLDRERPGAGLGLTLARTLAEAQGGTLTLTSELGKGSRFVLSLPAA